MYFLAGHFAQILILERGKFYKHNIKYTDTDTDADAEQSVYNFHNGINLVPNINHCNELIPESGEATNMTHTHNKPINNAIV